MCALFSALLKLYAAFIVLLSMPCAYGQALQQHLAVLQNTLHVLVTQVTTLPTTIDLSKLVNTAKKYPDPDITTVYPTLEEYADSLLSLSKQQIQNNKQVLQDFATQLTTANPYIAAALGLRMMHKSPQLFTTLGTVIRVPTAGQTERPTSSIAYNAEHNLIVATVYGNRGYVWDMQNLKLRATLSLPRNRQLFRSSILSRAGNLLVLSGQAYPSGIVSKENKKGTLDVWTITSAINYFKELNGFTDSVTGIAFAPSGTQLAAISDDNSIKVWNVATMERTFNITKAHDNFGQSICFNSTGNRAASAGFDGVVNIWETTNWKTTHSFGTENKYDPAHDVELSKLSTVACHPTNNSILALGLPRGGFDRPRATTVSIRVLSDAQQSTTLGEFTIPNEKIHSLAFNHDGTFLVCRGEQAALYIYNVQDKHYIGQLSYAPIGESPFCNALFDSSNRIVTGYKGFIGLWRIVPNNQSNFLQTLIALLMNHKLSA